MSKSYFILEMSVVKGDKTWSEYMTRQSCFRFHLSLKELGVKVQLEGG